MPHGMWYKNINEIGLKKDENPAVLERQFDRPFSEMHITGHNKLHEVILEQYWN